MDLILKLVEQINWENMMFSAIRILLILIFAWLLMFVAKISLKKLEKTLLEREEGEESSEDSKRAETLVRLLRQGVRIMLTVVAILVILREIGIQIGPILASAGIAGLAVGFGAQNLVRDVISGFFLILENQVRVGDVAVINGTGGLVENINFRTIILRDLSGTVHVFPNGSINTLANLTREWSAYVFDIGIAYKEDVDRVMEMMRELGAELRQDPKFGPLMVDDIEIFGVDQFADSAVIIKGRIRTKPIKQWDVGREYRRRLKNLFDEKGVEIPFPHRSIFIRETNSPLSAQLLNQSSDSV